MTKMTQTFPQWKHWNFTWLRTIIKFAAYGTGGRLFRTDVSANFKVM